MNSSNAVASVWTREVVADRRTVAAIGVGAMVACLALAAEVRLYTPLSEVPFTLQTFFVLVAGAGLGPRLGTVALSSYLALGAVGAPIFTGQWLGATTGYLVGFVAAGWVIGALVRRAAAPSLGRLVLAMALGDALLLACGAAWLAFGIGFGVPAAVARGITPFVAVEAAKIAVAAALCRSYEKRLRALFP
ncbi:MAG TPA: biotin transporter BioY [Planctomycetota bacterium]|nr:biotin transporter BioY [Planctomycetota bacterium]HRR81032.1 biotin transporter BioY [Planctomycetota bacterium]HRT93632.1 biotin transporter BioY [Planctomycetota bacterium]